MKDEVEILAQRAEAHLAACAGLDEDPLIRAAFDPPPPIKPQRSPLLPGALLARQAD